jgi:4-amino-4-deoxy-L-arabinose transferase-like glycosyltransferase
LYLLARVLFDHRVAVLSVFLYLFCDPLLNACVAGLPTCFLCVLFLVAVYGVFKAEQWAEAGRPPRWIYGALVAAALAVGLGTLTQYSFASLLVPLLVYVTVSFRKQRWYAKAGLCLAVYLAVLAPWVVRNWQVSETLFGLSRFELSEGVRVAFMTDIKPGQLQRTYGIDTKVRVIPILKKALQNGRQLYESTVKDIGANYLIAFFLASLLHHFRREEVFRLRRLVFWGLLVCVAWLAMAGVGTQNQLTMFLPLIIIYGCAFFFVLFERLQFRTRLLRGGMVALFAVLNMLPFVFTILPPAHSQPYPPYDCGVIAAMGSSFRESEVMVSDIPWAVAWYADRAAVWTPFEEKDYLAINDNVLAIAGIYLTQATLQQLQVMDMITGYQKFWLDRYRPPPANFPLQFFRPLTPDGQQVLLSNRSR